MPPGQGLEPARTDQPHFSRTGLAAPVQGGNRPGVLRQKGVRRLSAKASSISSRCKTRSLTPYSRSDWGSPAIGVIPVSPGRLSGERYAYRTLTRLARSFITTRTSTPASLTRTSSTYPHQTGSPRPSRTLTPQRSSPVRSTSFSAAPRMTISALSGPPKADQFRVTGVIDKSKLTGPKVPAFKFHRKACFHPIHSSLTGPLCACDNRLEAAQSGRYPFGRPHWPSSPPAGFAPPVGCTVARPDGYARRSPNRSR